MLRHIKKLRLKSRMAKNKQQHLPRLTDEESAQTPLSSSLLHNEEALRTIYANCWDVVFRSFWIAQKERALLIYIEGLSHAEEINQNVLAPLMEATDLQITTIDDLTDKTISVAGTSKVHTYTDIVEHISLGEPVLMMNGHKAGLALGLENWEKRSIEEPEAEHVVRGPRDGFVEALQVNTASLRHRLKSPRLKMEALKVGDYTKTDVVLTFIEEIADKNLLEEARNRIKRIKIDSILESGDIEELIEDHPFSPFPQVLDTERTDVATSYLLEGHVVIIVDGSPSVLIAPTTFYSMMQSAEDYYQRFLIGTAVRWLRYIFLFIALLLPSLYVAILTYHHEMVPTQLMISIAAAREPIPFPALVEAFVMEIIFEVLREAGLRLPKQIGPAVSIVGGLIIGEAAVQAGIVSAPMVIVVALTGISSFAIPRYSAGIAIRMLRFPLLILAGGLGLLGVILGIIAIIVHLCALRSFGVPYLTPIAPMEFRDIKDVLIRAPKWKLTTRPRLSGKANTYRASPHQQPGPHRGRDSS
ncbi:spore germination protein [Salsuginibacillus kocurii]|uniref:spore germination protein n=1 Tax=Salsuginibacillus kocurii TaxID=427078 RepID=UPI000381FFC4|nr:spore germination protein [Salsuginibacillus kocurii]